MLRTRVNPWQLHQLRSALCVRPRLLSTPVSTEEDRYLQTSPLPTMHFQKAMFRLPIPNLDKTLERYLAALEPVATSKEAYLTTKAVTEDIMTKKMLTLMQAKLMNSNRTNTHTSYITRPWFDMYLADRRPIMLNQNPFIAFKEDPELTDQAMRAANFVWSAVRFRASLLDEKLEPEVYHLNPAKTHNDKYWKIMKWVPGSMSTYVSALMKVFALDMSQYHSLFNSTRLPVLHAQDELVGYESSDQSKYGHVLVLRNDNMYTVRAVQDDGLPVPVQTLYNRLQGILDDQTPPSPHPLGCLTGLDRDRWAQHRIDLRHDNLDLLEAIDSALFVVCLDETTPTSPEGLTHQMLHNNGRNRWFDKSFQLIVTPGGYAAINFEHSWGDGVAVLRFFQGIHRDRKTVLSMCEPTMEGVKRLEFNVPASVREGSSSALTQLRDTCSSLSVNILQYEKYGKDFLKKMNVSPDAVLQLAIQLAYYRQFQHCTPTYESCSTAAFKHGRTETIRPASRATKECVEAFDSADPATLMNLINKAATHHSKLTKEAATGHGFDRHLFALRKLAESEGEEVALFTDPSYAHMNHIILSTSTLASDDILSGGFAPVTPDGYGVGYNIMKDWIGVQVTAYPTRDGKAMLDQLEKALDDLYSVFIRSSGKK